MLFLALFRVVFKPELHGSRQNNFWRKVAVGLGHDFPVNAAWRVAQRCPMVFDSLAHYRNLLRIEPFKQTLVGGENFPACHVVNGSRTTHANVVIGGYDVCHIDVGTNRFCQLQTLLYDALHVANVVASPECTVLWKYLRFHKLHQVKTYVLVHFDYFSGRFLVPCLQM